MQKRVDLLGRPYWVGLYREETYQWLAIGEIADTPIAVVARTSSQAIEKWRVAAVACLQGNAAL